MGVFDKITRTVLKRPPQKALTMNRNEPCWCGSGKKYKRCHHASDRKYFQSRGGSCKTRS